MILNTTDYIKVKIHPFHHINHMIDFKWTGLSEFTSKIHEDGTVTHRQLNNYIIIPFSNN